MGETRRSAANLDGTRYGQLLDASRDMISLNRLDSTVVYVSAACERVLGYRPDELVGRRALDLVHPEDAAAVAAVARALVEHEAPAMVEFRVLRRDGEPVWVESTAQSPRGDTIVVVTRDVTERHEWQELLMAAALHDPVTGLANRRMFDDRLEAEVARAERGRRALVLLFTDVDRFKAINDRYGHPTGDAVLREIADRISGAVRAEDVAARYGGDEFVALCPSRIHADP